MWRQGLRRTAYTPVAMAVDDPQARSQTEGVVHARHHHRDHHHHSHYYYPRSTRAHPHVAGETIMPGAVRTPPPMSGYVDQLRTGGGLRMPAAAAPMSSDGDETESDGYEDGVEGAEFDYIDQDDEEEDEEEEVEVEGAEEGEVEAEAEAELDDGEHDSYASTATQTLPADLRDISSLASWTVSTHKPGCGVSALRHPSADRFWQSDGPQPHTLTLHFFKRVDIVRLRVLLDFDRDESYTPTRMVFYASMGGAGELVEFANWQGETPVGWVEVSLVGVGGRHGHGYGSNGGERVPVRAVGDAHDGTDIDDENDNLDNDDDQDEQEDQDLADSNDPTAGNVLKAMVVQMRIMENHQNGKDTHVRGFQVFSRDERQAREAEQKQTAADVAGENWANGSKGENRGCNGDLYENGMGTIGSAAARVGGLNNRNGNSPSGGSNLVPGIDMLDLDDWIPEPEIR